MGVHAGPGAGVHGLKPRHPGLPEVEAGRHDQLHDQASIDRRPGHAAGQDADGAAETTHDDDHGQDEELLAVALDVRDQGPEAEADAEQQARQIAELAADEAGAAQRIAHDPGQATQHGDQGGEAHHDLQQALLHPMVPNIDLRPHGAYVPPLRRSFQTRPPPPRPLHSRTRAARPPVDVIVHGGQLRLGQVVADGEAEGECSTR